MTWSVPVGGGPLADAKAQLAAAVGHLGYDDGTHQMLATPRRELQVSVAGVSLCLVAGLSYAVYTLVSKHLVVHTPASTVTLSIFSCAALIAVPVAFAISATTR